MANLQYVTLTNCNYLYNVGYIIGTSENPFVLEDIGDSTQPTFIAQKSDGTLVTGTIDDLLKSSTPEINTISEELQPKYIPSQVKPVMEDYKVKYEDALASVHRLEEENMRLINELVEAKAKIETIKDIID